MPKQKSILITAGPTREMLDPVRFLSNLSTGEMGYTLAREARKRNIKTTLISGPTALKQPKGVRFISITSAEELKRACEVEFPKHALLVMTAAVCDFTASKKNSQKIQRTKTHQFLLKQTPDIIRGLSEKKGSKKVIGFCLETQNWLERGKEKIRRKSLDGIVANYYSKSHTPFGHRKINTAFIGKDEKILRLKNQTKTQVSRKLLDWAAREEWL